MSVCVLVAYAQDDVDKATIGLTLANTALDLGESVRVVLASEGVRLAVVGGAEVFDNGEPFKPVKQLLGDLLSKGGELNVCTPCLAKRRLAEAPLLDRVRRIGGAEVIRILKETDRSIQL